MIKLTKFVGRLYYKSEFSSLEIWLNPAHIIKMWASEEPFYNSPTPDHTTRYERRAVSKIVVAGEIDPGLTVSETPDQICKLIRESYGRVEISANPGTPLVVNVKPEAATP